MSSTPIPGWAYLIIGASVSGFSKFVESKKPETNLSIFFFIGLIFIAIGVFKIGIAYVTKNKNKSTNNTKRTMSTPRTSQMQMQNQNSNNNYKQNFQNPQNRQNQASQGGFLHNEIPQNQFKQNNFQNNTQHHITKVTDSAQPEHPSIITCAGCGVKHYSYANFCMMCGLMMKKR